MADYIPRQDGAFDAWLNQFIAGAAQWYDSHGGDGPLDPLRDLRDAWEAALAADVAAQNAAKAATVAKNQARAACEQVAREQGRFIQGVADTSNAQRAGMGLALRTDQPGPASIAPATVPLVSVELPARLTHTLRLSDSATPTRTKKPRGVHGAEVWLALTEPGAAAPTNPRAYTFHSVATRPTLRASYAPADGGKTAVYMLRWVSTRGERGPWSEVTTATVAA